jgi:hypothetical protein
MSVCWEYCVLSGRGLCVSLITRPEESYQMCMSDYVHEASTVTRPWFTMGCRAKKKKYPSGRTMALGSTQPLTEMSTRNISW